MVKDPFPLTQCKKKYGLWRDVEKTELGIGFLKTYILGGEKYIGFGIGPVVGEVGSRTSHLISRAIIL